ncbi:HRDC domain-containing protein [Microbacterium sp.]|uniref:ribonuclease D n=1 Tax=Microbacterium sp. TaxID=51671 RepID=UPI00261E425A|nr:HRDC domain-containing protein [Microbacterium sp.]MCV0333753.1 HRDC domain-containing protein [Microbacterium sp.]MCV0375032.1 HRDC domain-containing protein [Microbacterium sp.]MCV0388448.1 HRDC domain-containing protein [Microbacterium sp.]MCV0416975.1 HRDC domain-containing protein [Microbacterium sp.]MCV0420286.1 HRDC domain-containing protein [Microbacterium sp.]
MTEYSVISDAEEFRAACAVLAAGTGPVAVDVERASGFRYSQRAYLVQVFRREAGVFLFDPPAIGDFAPLQEAIGDVEWVLHAASQDLPSLRELHLEPPMIFDTELASRLLGHERVGLGAVVEDTLGIMLKKEHSAADWSTRPLPDSWLEYAALDVLHLIDVRDVLVLELEEQGKTEFAAEEFAATLARAPKPPREDPWRRLSGLHQVRGARNLAVARSLWQAREAYAQEQDVSPGRLVPDRSLVAAVLANPQSKQALAGLKEFQGRASRTQLDRWWQAIVEGRASEELPRERVPSDTLPPPRAWADRNPEADARLKAARPIVEAVAEELGMPTENLLTPEYLRRVAWDLPGETPEAIAAALAALGARPWQIEQTAQKIAAAFVEAAQTPDTTPAPAS